MGAYKLRDGLCNAAEKVPSAVEPAACMAARDPAGAVVFVSRDVRLQLQVVFPLLRGYDRGAEPALRRDARGLYSVRAYSIQFALWRAF